MQNLMQATLTVTLREDGLMEQVQNVITSVARQRPLTVKGPNTKNNTLIVQVGGNKLDVYVLTNTVASSFPQLQVKLELEKAPAGGVTSSWRGT